MGDVINFEEKIAQRKIKNDCNANDNSVCEVASDSLQEIYEKAEAYLKDAQRLEKEAAILRENANKIMLELSKVALAAVSMTEK